MTGKPPADQPTTAGFEFKRLLDLVTAQGTIIRAIPIGELEAINAIREMVIDAAEVQTTYTGSWRTASNRWARHCGALRQFEAGHDQSSIAIARSQVVDVLRSSPDPLVLDFTGVWGVTQSFADEFFRKLVDELPRVEVARIRVQNLTGGRCGTEPPEPGLHLYEEEGITGLEFPAGGRFVDILALDAQDNYVAIELKVSRGYDRVVGQLLRYIAWIRENQAEVPQTVRGMIVASEISEDLGLACSGLPDVKLFEYELSVAVRPVK